MNDVFKQHYQAKLKDKLEAPVQKGATAGTLTVTIAGDTLGYLDGQTHDTVTLKTTKQVARDNVFKLIFHGVGEWVGSLF